MAANPLATTDKVQNIDILFPTSKRVYHEVIK